MFVGHYGVSFAARARGLAIPLWVLFIAVQLLDVVWAPLVLLIQAYIFFGPPPASDKAAALTALAAYAIFAAVIRLLERRSHDVAAHA